MSHETSRRKHIYRNITKYNANKITYKCQIELYSVIPNFISRTIRHVLQENTFYGHNLKVLHKIITKEGWKGRNSQSCTFTTKWHREGTIYDLLLLTLLYEHKCFSTMFIKIIIVLLCKTLMWQYFLVRSEILLYNANLRRKQRK